MITFDDVLPALARITEATANFGELNRCAVVRDLRGRVRLVVERKSSGTSIDLAQLERELAAELADWFVAPILSTGDPRERGTLARKTFENGKTWKPSWQDPATGLEVRGAGQWVRIERRLSKEDWLDGDAARHPPPWPLHDHNPAIVTFYSFKGGVGRTTALVSCAWQLAREGKRIVALDLDLEAPGLSALLDVETDRGVLDVVIDHLATGHVDLQNAYGTARSLGEQASLVTVLPAGKLNLSFIEKLGRLDFVATDPWNMTSQSPVELALSALLEAIRRELKPDYILIDSRAGLHDLAGLSLHRLAHVDVLVGRANEQGYGGLDLTLTALAARKGRNEMRTILLHTMAPTDPTSAEGIAEKQEFRARAWQSFMKRVYPADYPTSRETDPVGHHIPIQIEFNLALTRFASLGGISQHLFASGFLDLKTRVESLSAPEDKT
jgi:MinD-like ATPase involved in chromosome partitioning or flagellar assembly